jgi:hypothetical protein
VLTLESSFLLAGHGTKRRLSRVSNARSGEDRGDVWNLRGAVPGLLFARSRVAQVEEKRTVAGDWFLATSGGAAAT